MLAPVEYPGVWQSTVSQFLMELVPYPSAQGLLELECDSFLEKFSELLLVYPLELLQGQFRRASIQVGQGWLTSNNHHPIGLAQCELQL